MYHPAAEKNRPALRQSFPESVNFPGTENRTPHPGPHQYGHALPPCPTFLFSVARDLPLVLVFLPLESLPLISPPLASPPLMPPPPAPSVPAPAVPADLGFPQEVPPVFPSASAPLGSPPAAPAPDAALSGRNLSAPAHSPTPGCPCRHLPLPVLPPPSVSAADTSLC